MKREGSFKFCKIWPIFFNLLVQFTLNKNWQNPWVSRIMPISNVMTKQDMKIPKRCQSHGSFIPRPIMIVTSSPLSMTLITYLWCHQKASLCIVIPAASLIRVQWCFIMMSEVYGKSSYDWHLYVAIDQQLSASVICFNDWCKIKVFVFVIKKKPRPKVTQTYLLYCFVYGWGCGLVCRVVFLVYMKPDLDVPKSTEWQKKQISHKCARRISISAVISSAANCQ